MAFPFHIHQIIFKDSQYEKSPQLDFTLSNVTILIGPNNSGKSQVLKDIEKYCFGTDTSTLKILKDVVFAIPGSESDSEIQELLTTFKSTPPKNRGIGHNQIFLSSHDFRESGNRRLEYTIDLQEYTWRIKQSKVSGVRPEISSLFTIKLDGRTRFDLTIPRNLGDLNAPENFLVTLYRKDKERERLREIIFNEFGLYCYLDSTQGNLQIKLNQNKMDSKQEKSHDEETINFFNESYSVNDVGDGIQAFVGLLMVVSSMPHRIMLIDEPEAFLHPPQANHLGNNLTTFAKERGASLIAATHSVDFLMGCLEKSPDVTILRLTYDGSKGTVKQLSSDDVMSIMGDSLLRSTSTLSTLFHKSAVVTESDTDRVFYSEINRRLETKKLGIEDTMFLNAHGKTDVHRIIGILRKIGVPAACIYDLDVLNLQSNQWEEIFKIVKLTDAEIKKLEEDRQFVLNELIGKKKDNEPNPLKKQGLPILDEKTKARGYAFLEILAKYGIFLVDLGELEQWLKPFGIGAGNKASWLSGILKKLDDEKSYKMNQKEDVWKFLIRIKKWIEDPNRLGM